MIKRKKLGKGLEDIAHYYLSDDEKREDEGPFEERDKGITTVIGCIAPYSGTGFTIELLSECLTHLKSSVSFQYLGWGGKNGGILHRTISPNSSISPIINFHFYLLETGISRGLIKFVVEIDTLLFILNLKNPLSASRSLSYLKQICRVDPYKWIGIITESEPLPRNGVSSINHLCKTLRQLFHISPHFLGSFPHTRVSEHSEDREIRDCALRNAYLRIATSLYSGVMRKTQN
jgi:hypothetical protein